MLSTATVCVTHAFHYYGVTTTVCTAHAMHCSCNALLTLCTAHATHCYSVHHSRYAPLTLPPLKCAPLTLRTTHTVHHSHYAPLTLCTTHAMQYYGAHRSRGHATHCSWSFYTPLTATLSTTNVNAKHH